MLVEAIADKFNTYFKQSADHNTVLWFDPEREWEGLLPYLRPHLPMLEFEGSLLHLRYQLVERSQDQRYVVYLPFEALQSTRRGEAEYLRPLIYTSKVFDDPIETVLHDQGVNFPQGYGKMREIRPHLPALAVASVGKGQAFWDALESVDSVLARLIPDFEDRLMQLLTSPDRTKQIFAGPEQENAFFTLLESEFGTMPPEPGEEERWANRFTAELCLVKTFVAADKPSDFPFEQALPDPVHWDRCLNFLNTWQRDEMFNHAFARRARAMDERYNLANWVKSLPESPKANAFLNVERAIWERMKARLDQVSDKDGAVEFCRAHRETFQERAKGFWVRDGALSGWSALARMAEVIIGADNALDEYSQYSHVHAMIERYTQSWWQVDRAYRCFNDQAKRGAGQLDTARKWTRRIYREYLETINATFGEMLVDARDWPSDDLSIGAGDLWEGALSKGKERRALILVDALRYEWGRDLSERLLPNTQASPGSLLSPLPSVTALGMAALLPGWSDFEVDYLDGKWSVVASEFDGDLAEKRYRLAWLEKQLGRVATFNLDEWLTLPLDEAPEDLDWLIISSTEIDTVGEGAGPVTWHTAEALLDRLEQAIRRLLAQNCAEIHVLSDHGFLLRESVRESDKVTVDVPSEQLLKRSERYLLLQGKDPAPIELPSLPVSGSADLTAVFPRGIGCFFTPGPYDFMHGGISLQELVTAHITVRQSIEEKPVSVSLELMPGDEIRNAIFKIRLVPQDVDLLSRPRKVEISIASKGERLSSMWEAVVNKDVVEKSLRLSSQMNLDEGDTIAVQVWDADTGELLAQQSAVVQIDLDW
jgi:hypothetical protein